MIWIRTWCVNSSHVCRSRSKRDVSERTLPAITSKMASRTCQCDSPESWRSPPSKHKTLKQWWLNAGPASETVAQHQAIIGSTSCVFSGSTTMWLCEDNIHWQIPDSMITKHDITIISLIITAYKIITKLSSENSMVNCSSYCISRRLNCSNCKIV